MRGFGLERGFPLDALIAYTPYVAVAALLAAGVALALRNWAAAVVGALALVWLAAGIAPRAIGSDESPGPATSSSTSSRRTSTTGPPTPTPSSTCRSPRGRPPHGRGADAELRRGAAARRHRARGSRTRSSRCTGARAAAASTRSFPLRRLSGPAHGRIPDAAGARSALPGGRASGSSPSIPTRRTRAAPPAGAPASTPCRAPSRAAPPWVLPGDFNATLDHAELRRVLDLGYRDAGDVTGNGLIPTWPEFGHHLPPITIDHILAQRGIRDPLLRGRGHPGERPPRRLRAAGDPDEA